jgi:hypothetical protein
MSWGSSPPSNKGMHAASGARIFVKGSSLFIYLFLILILMDKKIKAKQNLIKTIKK